LGDLLTKAFLGRRVTGFMRATQANVQSIVHGIQALCTMLHLRKPPIWNDFALPTGTVVHSIHCAYPQGNRMNFNTSLMAPMLPRP
jgi:hypothetical protein